MDALKSSKSKHNSNKSQVSEATTGLLDESKKMAHELYEEGLKHVDAVQKDVLHYSDDVLKAVRENPLKALLIAGGVGFILSALLKK